MPGTDRGCIPRTSLCPQSWQLSQSLASWLRVRDGGRNFTARSNFGKEGLDDILNGRSASEAGPCQSNPADELVARIDRDNEPHIGAAFAAPTHQQRFDVGRQLSHQAVTFNDRVPRLERQ